MRSSILAFVVSCGLALAFCPANVEAQAPPDIVRLHDGSFVRGTIIERTPGQVTILLPTGETRVYSGGDVAFAGPDSSLAMVQAPAAPLGPPQARLHVTSDREDGPLSLQRLSGTATVAVWTGRTAGTAVIDSFDVICNAPCDVSIPEGTYQLGVAHDTGSAQRAGRPMALRGDMHLHLDYESREALRIGGWISFVLGNLLGGGLVLGSIFIDNDINLPMLIGGSVLYGAGYIIWLVLAFFNDHADVIDVSHGGAVRF